MKKKYYIKYSYHDGNGNVGFDSTFAIGDHPITQLDIENALDLCKGDYLRENGLNELPQHVVFAIDSMIPLES